MINTLIDNNNTIQNRMKKLMSKIFENDKNYVKHVDAQVQSALFYTSLNIFEICRYVEIIYEHQKTQGNNIDKSKIKSYQEYQNNVINMLEKVNIKIEKNTVATEGIIKKLNACLHNIENILYFNIMNKKLYITTDKVFMYNLSSSMNDLETELSQKK